MYAYIIQRLLLFFNYIINKMYISAGSKETNTGEKHTGYKGISPKAVYNRRKSSRIHVQQMCSKKDDKCLLFQNSG